MNALRLAVLNKPLLFPNPLPTEDFLGKIMNSPQAPPVAKKPKFRCDIRASFATAFHNWRVKNKIPLKKIAKDLGLAVATVNSWELGERFPTGAISKCWWTTPACPRAGSSASWRTSAFRLIAPSRWAESLRRLPHPCNGGNVKTRPLHSKWKNIPRFFVLRAHSGFRFKDCLCKSKRQLVDTMNGSNGGLRLVLLNRLCASRGPFLWKDPNAFAH